MLEPAIIDLYSPAGDTFTQTFRLLDAGAPIDLTGATVASELVNRRTGATFPLAVTMGGDPGEFTLAWGTTPAPSGRYRYDIEVTKATVVRTWVKGRFHVEQDVTNAP